MSSSPVAPRGDVDLFAALLALLPASVVFKYTSTTAQGRTKDAAAFAKLFKATAPGSHWVAVRAALSTSFSLDDAVSNMRLLLQRFLAVTPEELALFNIAGLAASPTVNLALATFLSTHSSATGLPLPVPAPVPASASASASAAATVPSPPAVDVAVLQAAAREASGQQLRTGSRVPSPVPASTVQVAQPDDDDAEFLGVASTPASASVSAAPVTSTQAATSAPLPLATPTPADAAAAVVPADSQPVNTARARASTRTAPVARATSPTAPRPTVQATLVDFGHVTRPTTEQRVAFAADEAARLAPAMSHGVTALAGAHRRTAASAFGAAGTGGGFVGDTFPAAPLPTDTLARFAPNPYLPHSLLAPAMPYFRDLPAFPPHNYASYPRGYADPYDFYSAPPLDVFAPLDMPAPFEHRSRSPFRDWARDGRDRYSPPAAWAPGMGAGLPAPPPAPYRAEPEPAPRQVEAAQADPSLLADLLTTQKLNTADKMVDAAQGFAAARSVYELASIARQQTRAVVAALKRIREPALGQQLLTALDVIESTIHEDAGVYGLPVLASYARAAWHACVQSLRGFVSHTAALDAHVAQMGTSRQRARDLSESITGTPPFPQPAPSPQPAPAPARTRDDSRSRDDGRGQQQRPRHEYERRAPAAHERRDDDRPGPSRSAHNAAREPESPARASRSAEHSLLYDRCLQAFGGLVQHANQCFVCVSLGRPNVPGGANHTMVTCPNKAEAITLMSRMPGPLSR